MKTIKKILLATILSLYGLINLSLFSVASAQTVYDDVLGNTITSESLSSAIKGGNVSSDKGANLFNTQVITIIGYVMDIFIVLGITVAFIGGYKIMTSSKEDSLKDGIRLVVFGILGIIIMVSARFLAEGLVGSNGIITHEFTNLNNDNQPNGIRLASDLYSKIIYPFIKIALYLVVGILFFMMAAKVVGFATSTDDSAKKKAGGVIIWCVIGILIVMGSKQLVEAVMGRQETVLNKNAEWINGGGTTGMGNSILWFENIPLIVQVINWVMGLTMFIILVLIIIQGYKMFTKPDDPKNRESLKKTLLYIIIGVLVIGAAYAISSVLVINKVPVISE